MPRKPLDGVTRKTLETGGQASFLPGLLAPAEGGGCGGLAPCKSPPETDEKKAQKWPSENVFFLILIIPKHLSCLKMPSNP